VGLNGNLGLGFVFTARDLASAKMAGIERRFRSLDQQVAGGTDRMTGAFRRLGVGLAVFTAGAGMVAGAFSLANAAGNFEQGLAGVGAVTRATTDQLAMLRDAAIEAGIVTQFSPDEAVAGLTSLATAGQTAAQATQTLLPVLDLAAGSLGQLGVAQSAEAVVGTLNAYGMAASEAAGVTDKLLRVTQLTNFQTRDFEAGLSKAAATGAVFGQSLDDVLIGMGLLRNRNIDASSSATAFREATRRVGAESRAQKAILGAGIAIFDETSGKMRSIVDIMSDFARASDGMSEAERNRRVVTAFGARGLLAFNAIMNAAFTTTRNGREVTLKGAEAIAALREEMQGAGGTAAGFREKLLDTFQGQKTLLRGTLQTFAVVLGEPFAQILKPIVRGFTDALNAVLRVVKSLPMPVKKAIAGVIVGAGAFLALTGAVIAARGAFALLGMGLKAVGLSFRGIFAMILPAASFVALLIGAFVALRHAFARNLGGIADMARRLWAQVQLFFGGLRQLFTQGGFSGAVRDELARAENQGLKGFLVAIFQTVHRVRALWDGFVAGFEAGIAAARGVFRALSDAFSELGAEIVGVFEELTGSAAGLPSAEFRSFGEVVGGAFATVVRWATEAVTILTRISGGVVAGFRSMMRYIGPALEVVWEALQELGRALASFMEAIGLSSGAAGTATSGWRTFGEVLGKIVGGAVTVVSLALGGLIKTLAWLVNAIVAVGTWLGETAAKIVLWFSEDLPAALRSAWDTITGFFAGVGDFFSEVGRWFLDLFRSIADGIKAFFQPVVDFFTGIVDAIRSALQYLEDTLIELVRMIPDWLLPAGLAEWQASLRTSGEIAGEKARASIQPIVDRYKVEHSAELGAMPAAASEGSMAAFRELQIAMLALMDDAQQRSAAQPQPPIAVSLQVDGETIARAVQRADRDAAGRAFAPVATY
jgi:TP901 family phage tail tape measure protein